MARPGCLVALLAGCGAGAAAPAAPAADPAAPVIANAAEQEPTRREPPETSAFGALVEGTDASTLIEDKKPAIKRVISSALPKFTHCYEQALLSDPNLSGTTYASFEIGADGAVLASTAQGFVSAVDDCVAAVILQLVFPAMAPPTKVNYPFTFRPDSP